MARQSATVFEEKSKVIQQTEFAGEQFILTLEAQKSSITALPGEFAFVDCGENIMLRRPLSYFCLLYTSPSPRDLSTSRMPSSA